MTTQDMQKFIQNSVLGKDIVYSGDRYTDPRTIEDSLSTLETQIKNENESCINEIRKIASAQKTLAKSINETLSQETGSLEYLKSTMLALLTFQGKKAFRNFKGLMQKFPGMKNFAGDRALAELLIENLELAQGRTRETGKYVKQVEKMLGDHLNMIDFLNKKRLEVLNNRDTSLRHIEELKKHIALLEEKLKSFEKDSKDYLETETKLDRAQRELSETTTLLNLFQSAETRLETIVKLRKITRNNIESLKSGAYIVYQSAYEFLSEIEPLIQELAIASTGVETLSSTVRTVSGLKNNILAVAQFVSDAALLVEADLDKMVAEMIDMPQEKIEKLELQQSQIEKIRMEKYEKVKQSIENEKKTAMSDHPKINSSSIVDSSSIIDSSSARLTTKADG